MVGSPLGDDGLAPVYAAPLGGRLALPGTCGGKSGRRGIAVVAVLVVAVDAVVVALAGVHEAASAVAGAAVLPLGAALLSAATGVVALGKVGCQRRPALCEAVPGRAGRA